MRLIGIILRAIGLAMGVSVTVLALLRDITVGNAFVMLGIGLTCLSVASLQKFDEKK